MFKNIEAAKHAARRLRKHCKQEGDSIALSKSQLMIARSCGEKDWHALQTAVDGGKVMSPPLHQVAENLREAGLNNFTGLDLLKAAELVIPEPVVGPEDHLAIMSGIKTSPALAEISRRTPGNEEIRTRVEILEESDIDEEEPPYWIIRRIDAAIGPEDSPIAAGSALLVYTWQCPMEHYLDILERTGAPRTTIKAFTRPTDQISTISMVVTDLETDKDHRGQGHGTSVIAAMTRMAAQELGEIKPSLLYAVSDPINPLPDTQAQAACDWFRRPGLRYAITNAGAKGFALLAVNGERDETGCGRAADSTIARSNAKQRKGRDTIIEEWPIGQDERSPLDGTFDPHSNLLEWLPPQYISISLEAKEVDWLEDGARSTLKEGRLISADGNETVFGQEDVEAVARMEQIADDPFVVAMRNMAMCYRRVARPVEVDETFNITLTRESSMIEGSAIIGGVDPDGLTDAMMEHIDDDMEENLRSELLDIAMQAIEDEDSTLYDRKADKVLNERTDHLLRLAAALVGNEDYISLRTDQSVARAVSRNIRLYEVIRHSIGRMIHDGIRKKQHEKSALTPAARDLLFALARGTTIDVDISQGLESARWRSSRFSDESINAPTDAGIRLMEQELATIERSRHGQDHVLRPTVKGLMVAKSLGGTIYEKYEVDGHPDVEAPPIKEDVTPISPLIERDCDQSFGIARRDHGWDKDKDEIAFIFHDHGMKREITLPVATVRTMDSLLSQAGKALKPITTGLGPDADLIIGGPDNPAAMEFRYGLDRMRVDLPAPLHRMMRLLLKEQVKKGAQAGRFEPVDVTWLSLA